MAYDWRVSLPFRPGTREWFDEIDRRFFGAAYFARGPEGEPFGRYLRPELVDGRSILEIGCGTGSHAALLARAGADLTAIDLTRSAVDATRQRFEVFGLRGRILCADAEALPFSPDSFDFIWSWGVLHHSSSFERCLSEVRRVLRPGGHLLLMVYHRHSLFYYLHCGLIRGVLLGQLRTRTLTDIYNQNVDGAYARMFRRRELAFLLDPHFKPLCLTVVGQKNELLPLPRSALKSRMEQMIPEQLASAVLGCCGFFLVAEGTRLP